MTEHPDQIRTTGVNLGGLMTVLGQYLYSTPVVAIRELVQNAHDAIVRRRLEDPSGAEGATILVEGDEAAGKIRVTDTGAGLTDVEIGNYLATVGVGYTRKLREETDSDELIGMFGLGFLSAFVLANKVTVTTTSWQDPTRGWRYQSQNGERYTLSAVAPGPVGAVVELTLRDEYRDLAHHDSLLGILTHYCALLHVPVRIGAGAEPINAEPPPWRLPASTVASHPVQRTRQALAFAARFEHHFEPLCTLPVLSETDDGTAGLLWVQSGTTYGNADNRHLSVFVRGMLLADSASASELLPRWAGFVGGVIESSLLKPTASREDLMRDRNYQATQRLLAESLIRGLAAIAREQPAVWRTVLTRHSQALRGAALCDPRLFDLLADAVTLPTSQGELRAEEIVSDGKLYIKDDEHHGFEDVLFRTLKVPVAYGQLAAVTGFLRNWAEQRGVTVVEIGSHAGNRRLFAQAELPEVERRWLGDILADGESVSLARFAPVSLPVVVLQDREAELKRRIEADEADRRMGAAVLGLVRQFTANIANKPPADLYINLDNPAIQSLLDAYRRGNPRATEAAGLIRVLKTLMASGQAAPGAMSLDEALGQVGAIVESLLVAKE